jgi:hypothetical protein
MRVHLLFDALRPDHATNARLNVLKCPQKRPQKLLEM